MAGRGTSPPQFGVGDANANCPLRFLSCRYKKEHSVAFKIRQNPFSAGALPWTPLGSSRRSPDSQVGWRGDTLLHTPPNSGPIHLRRSLFVLQNSIYAYGRCQDFRCGGCTLSLPQMLMTLFTALHVMQTRSCDENSVRPSVCLSVRLSFKRVNCDKSEERYV